MSKFVQTVLRDGPRFMESAQRNFKGAVVLLIFVLLVLGTLALGLTFGASRLMLAFF